MAGKKFTTVKKQVCEGAELGREPVVIPPYVLVEMYFKPDGKGKPYVGRGFAKCCPRDIWNEVRGIDIARGRAEVDIARQLCAK